jgi:hypothetical protein
MLEELEKILKLFIPATILQKLYADKESLITQKILKTAEIFNQAKIKNNEQLEKINDYLLIKYSFIEAPKQPLHEIIDKLSMIYKGILYGLNADQIILYADMQFSIEQIQELMTTLQTLTHDQAELIANPQFSPNKIKILRMMIEKNFSHDTIQKFLNIKLNDNQLEELLDPELNENQFLSIITQPLPRNNLDLYLLIQKAKEKVINTNKGGKDEQKRNKRMAESRKRI